MHTPLLANRLSRWLAVGALALLAAPAAQAQLSGAKAIPGDYATVAAAITALNAQGVGAGGVTFNLAAAYTETFASPTAGHITATGTAANPVVFQKAGTGANPLITGGAGAGAQDAVIALLGSDYVSFTGIDVADDAANTTAATQMEFGYALFRVSATDGCQSVSISSATVTLNKANVATVGIWGANTTAAATTAVTATSAAGANSNLRLNGNTIANSFIGIYVAGNTATVANSDTGNEIGTTAGNTLANLGGANTNVYGIRAEFQNGLRIENNTVAIPVGNTSTTVRGIGTGAGSTTGMTGTLLLNNNTVTVASATSGTVWGINQAGTSALTTVDITNNKVQNSALTSTGAVYYIQDASSVTAVVTTIAGNRITGNSAATAGTVVGIQRSGTAGTANISANVVGTAASGNTVTAAGGTYYGIQASTGTITLTGNSIVNNTFTATGTGAATVYGYYNFGSPTAETLTNNTVSGLSIAGSGTATTHVLGGLYTNSTGTAVKVISGNTVANLTVGTAGGTAAGAVAGIFQYLGTTLTLNQNKIYGLTSYGAAGSVTGLLLGSGTTVTAANNLIGNLTAPAATGLAAISGVQVAGGTTANLYHNSIYLNAASTGATFGTSGIYLNSTSTTLNARNNVVVNKSTAAGTGGYTVALRRVSGTAGAAPANLASTANNNLYYAGTPAATNVIYAEGTTGATNVQQTLAAYKAFVAARESASVTEDPPFLSTTGTDAAFLHVSTATATQIEGGGTAISSITVDYDGDPRSTSTPDIGADEGTFVPLDLSGPVISYTPLGNTASTASRTLTVTIADANGVATGANAPRLYFNKNGGAYSFVNATSVSGNTHTFTFDFALLGGVAAFDVVQYYVAAQDLAPSQNVATSPLGGSGSNPPGTAFAGTPNQFVIQGTLSGVYYVGTGTSPQPARTYATLTAAANAYNNNLLGGAVTLLLLDNAYGAAEIFPIAFQANTTSSATNALTIKPNAGVTATITSSAAASATIQLNGASYLVLDGSNTAGGTTRDLTIANSNAAGGAAVQLISLGLGAGAANNTLRNLNLSTASSNAGIAIAAGGAAIGAAGADNDNLTIENNNIGPAFVGIYAGGSTAVGAGANDGLLVAGNTIGGAVGSAGVIGSIGAFVANAVAPTFSDNTVQNLTGSSVLYGFNFPTGVTNATFTRNTVQNLAGTSGATYGVNFAGTGTTGNTISQNTVRNLSAPAATYGINFAGATMTGNTLTQNTVQNLTAAGANAYGLFLGAGFTAGTVTRNQVLNISATGADGYGAKGIDVVTGSATSNLLIANNFVQITAASGWTSLTSDANVGIRLGTGGTLGGVTLYHNSVSLTGTDVRNAADLSAALYVGSTSTALNIRNNVFRNDIVTSGTTGKSYAFYSAAANTAFADINYNDYFVAGSQGVPGFLASDRTTLAAIQAATGKDAASLNADPLFQSATDLHAASAALNNAGTPIAAVTVDIDGETRSTTTPDIGADEFAPVAVDVAAVALVAPVQPAASGTCYGSAEAVTVQIRNAGSTAIDFSVNPATVSVVVAGPGTPGTFVPVVISTGTLAPGATQNVTFPTTANLSAAGTYSFAVTATATGDGNAANNTLAVAPTVVVTAPTVGALSPLTANICRSGTATLTLSRAANGTIQYQQSSSATGTFTDVAGATAASFITPTLTATTYYRAQVRCGTNVVTSNVSAVVVNDPQATVTNSPVAVCTGSPATLTATAPAGSNTAFRFFASATGGTALAGAATTGGTTSLTTGNLTASTQYYVEAYTPGGGSESVGLATAAGSASLSLPSGLQFNTTGPTTFYSAVVYPIGTGTITVSILTGPTGTEVASTPAIPVTGTGLATPVTIPLNLSLPTAVTGYVIQVKTSTGITGLIRENPLPTGVTFPLPTSAGGFTITTGVNIGSAIAAYYFLYNIQVSADCVAPTRTAIQVNVNPVTTADFSYGTTSTYCVSGTTAPGVVLATGATAGTFSSTVGLTLDATTGAITLATSTPGAYTVTNTVPTTASQCGSTATTSVTITAAPTATFSYANAAGCVGSTTAATPALATGATAGTFSSTTGLTIDATTGAITLATSTAGSYTVTNTVAAAGGCAAVTATATFTVNPRPATPTLTAAYNGANTTLTSSAATGNQFFLGGVAIAGATGQTYVVNGTPAQLGSYTVVVTNAQGCASLPSVPLVVTTTKNGIAGASLKLYPNPTPTGRVTLELTGYRSATQLTVLDALGRVVVSELLPAAAGTATRPLDLTGVATGVYLLRLSNADGVETRRLVRE